MTNPAADASLFGASVACRKFALPPLFAVGRVGTDRRSGPGWGAGPHARSKRRAPHPSPPHHALRARGEGGIWGTQCAKQRKLISTGEGPTPRIPFTDIGPNS